MNVVFLGPPGAGKGTQCKMIVERYGLQHLSSGDILRRERKNNTDLGQKAQSFMDAGQLVPDDLIVAMMMKEIQAAQGVKGFILDGFPRTLGQARELDAALQKAGQKIDVVLELQVDDAKLEARVTGRRSCGKCGAAYHVTFNPSLQADQCDAGCGTLTQRSDDTAAVVRSRIETYHAQTAPLVAYYSGQGSVSSVDGNQEIDQVTQDLFRVLDAL